MAPEFRDGCIGLVLLADQVEQTPVTWLFVQG
jgi:hypothetical protein